MTIITPEQRAWIGKFAIRPGNEYQAPKFVYVSGVNLMDLLICPELNSATVVFSKPEQLLPVDYQKFKLMQAEWSYTNSLTVVERRLEQLNRIKDGDV